MVARVLFADRGRKLRHQSGEQEGQAEYTYKRSSATQRIGVDVEEDFSPFGVYIQTGV
ncbi:hypothetical protein BH10CHL1_BH10CHL1_17460 [soil metagenome]